MDGTDGMMKTATWPRQGRHRPFRALSVELTARVVMFVPILRGRAAVTLGHDTSLLGPDGFTYGRSRLDHVNISADASLIVAVVNFAVPF
jgi:hypothetical protein